MRKIIINTFVTLDGVMQAPGGPDEDTTSGFKYGGWSFHYWDDMMDKNMAEFMGKPFDLLLGRKTFEIFAGYWPNVKNDPGADALNSAKKYVASRTLNKVDWNNSTLIKGDLVKEIRKLKEMDAPELQVHGSSNFIQTLVKNNLIDVYRLWIYPVIVGSGKRLFEDGINAAALKLVDTKTSTSGVILATYVPGGEIKTGSFAAENPAEAELDKSNK